MRVPGGFVVLVVALGMWWRLTAWLSTGQMARHGGDDVGSGDVAAAAAVAAEGMEMSRKKEERVFFF